MLGDLQEISILELRTQVPSKFSVVRENLALSTWLLYTLLNGTLPTKSTWDSALTYVGTTNSTLVNSRSSDNNTESTDSPVSKQPLDYSDN